MAFQLRSTSFATNGLIPARFTGEGEDVSPELEWHDPPKGTRELALVCDDPDAPQKEPWVHWLAYRIPASQTKIPVGESGKPMQDRSTEFLEGRNSWERMGYGGPLPPPGHGAHHYNFTLYALDEPLDLDPGLSKAELLAALEGHILGEAKLTGTYARW